MIFGRVKGSYFVITHIGLAVLLLFFAVISYSAAEVRGYVDRNSISMGETVQFTLELRKRVSEEPDTASLEKDFEVLGVSTSSRVSFVNGNMEAYTSWIMTLSPRHEGVLTIPPVYVAGLSSDPVELTVTKAPKSIHDSSVDIFIETEFKPEKSYVQQQILYRVRLFYGPGLKEGSLEDPVVDNAVVKRLGKDASYDTEKNGKRYRVTERTYALFFQESGEHSIEAPLFDGKVADRTRNSSMGSFGSFFNNDPFGMIGPSRRVRIKGDSQLIKVLPRPDSVKGDVWLPAEMVELGEEWSSERNEYKLGEPVTRTLTITAKGLTGAQLPDLSEKEVPGFRVYPDKAEVTSEEIDDAILGKRVQKIAYIPEESGNYTLPSVTLQWWNIRSGKMQTARLPERQIQILKIPGQDNEPVVSNSGSLGQVSNGVKANVFSSVEQKEQIVAQRNQKFWMVLFFIISVVWFVTLVLLLRERRKKGDFYASPGSRVQTDSLVKPARDRFRKICRQGDPHLARGALLQWGSAVWPENPPKGLCDLGERVQDQVFSRELERLDRILYGFDDGSGWSGQSLLDVFEKVAGKSVSCEGSKKSVLPELYLSGSV